MTETVKPFTPEELAHMRKVSKQRGIDFETMLEVMNLTNRLLAAIDGQQNHTILAALTNILSLGLERGLFAPENLQQMVSLAHVNAVPMKEGH